MLKSIQDLAEAFKTCLPFFFGGGGVGGPHLLISHVRIDTFEFLMSLMIPDKEVTPPSQCLQLYPTV